MLADGTLLVAGRPITPPELSQRLAERRSVHGDALEVRIRSDRSVEYARVEPILLSCARSGVWNVAFAVYRREEAR